MSHWEEYKVSQYLCVISNWELIRLSSLPLKQSKHNKSYSDHGEDERRRAIFEENLVKVDLHNEKFKKGEVSYEMGVNQFSDLTEDERKARTGGGRMAASPQK